MIIRGFETSIFYSGELDENKGYSSLRIYMNSENGRNITDILWTKDKKGEVRYSIYFPFVHTSRGLQNHYKDILLKAPNIFDGKPHRIYLKYEFFTQNELEVSGIRTVKIDDYTIEDRVQFLTQWQSIYENLAPASPSINPYDVKNNKLYRWSFKSL